jgi:hypothetical protein
MVGIRARAADRAGPCAGVQADQDKPGNVPADVAAFGSTAIDLSNAPRGPDQISGFFPRQPTVARRVRVWQHRAKHPACATDLVSNVPVDRGR